MNKTNQVSRQMLELYHFKELSAEEQKFVEAELAADEKLRRYYKKFKDSEEEIRRRYPLERLTKLTSFMNNEEPISETDKIKQNRSFSSWSPRKKLLLGLGAAAVLLCVLIPSLFYLRGRNLNNKIEQVAVIPENPKENAMEIVSAPGSGQGMSETIPDNTTFIEDNQYSNLQLTSFSIQDNITKIGNNAFSNNLLTSVLIPESVVTIGDWAFSNNQLTRVYMQNGIILIGEGAFANNSLTSIIIPGSVVFIGDKAFAGNQLTSVTIGANVATDGAIPGNFINAYNINNNAAGTYTRPNASSDVWTKQ